MLGVYNRSYFFSNPVSFSDIPEVESLVFKKQAGAKTTSHTVADVTPHEITISSPPAKQYSTRYLVVFLEKKILGAIEGKKYVHTYYNISLPRDTSKGKSTKGDGLVPIGDYYILSHELRGTAMYLVLNYPSSRDAANALKSGIISQDDYTRIINANKSGSLPPFNTPLGGPVFIRGDIQPGMNTAGNIGIPPAAMRTIWEFAKKGTPVRILP